MWDGEMAVVEPGVDDPGALPGGLAVAILGLSEAVLVAWNKNLFSW